MCSELVLNYLEMTETGNRKEKAAFWWNVAIDIFSSKYTQGSCYIPNTKTKDFLSIQRAKQQFSTSIFYLYNG